MTDACVLEKTIFLAQSVARVQLRTHLFLSIDIANQTTILVGFNSFLSNLVRNSGTRVQFPEHPCSFL